MAGPESLTVPKLKQRLRERGLATSGRKGELIARLTEASCAEPVDAANSVSHLTVQQLRTRLREHGATTSGRKAELVQRLREVQRGQVPLSGSQLGRKFRGRVTRKNRVGIYVDIGAEHDGLVGASWLSGVGSDGLEESVESGQEVDTWIVAAATAEGRQRLALSLTRPAPDLADFVDLSPAEWLVGTVRCVMSFGLFVEVQLPGGGPAQWGMVSAAQRSEDGDVRIGQEVRVRVVVVEPSAGRLGLSMREPDDALAT